MLHSLAATPETVYWGFLDTALPPVLRIQSGDAVSIDSISGDVNALPPPGVAYPLMSLACDLHVTQLVDGNKGIHAMIAKSVVHSGRRS